jgi:hypothetical protein
MPTLYLHKTVNREDVFVRTVNVPDTCKSVSDRAEWLAQNGFGPGHTLLNGPVRYKDTPAERAWLSRRTRPVPSAAATIIGKLSKR